MKSRSDQKQAMPDVTKRPYAQRLPPHLSRRALLCVRVREEVKMEIVKVAAALGLSLSEYIARLVDENLSNSHERES
jgi:predicted HicB family RNase H-like nuclease